MTDDRLPRYQIAEGCWIVSSEGTSRSGDAMADTVRAIFAGVDQRLAERDARRAALRATDPTATKGPTT